MNKTQDAAVRYIRAGLAPVPIYNGKDPGRNGWQNTRITEEQAGEYFTAGANIGVLTGEPSGGVVDVDLDCPEAVSLAGRFLAPTLTAGRQSRPHSHWWYGAPGCKTLEFRDGKDKIVELRADGRQTLVAPSLHPEGDSYIWHFESGEMAEVEADELAAAVRRLATATLIARHLPEHRKLGEGGRHDFALALAGFMLRPGRLDSESVRAVLLAAWDAGGWPSEGDKREAHKDIEAAVSDTLSKLERGEPATGGRTLEEMEPGLPRTIARYWGWGDDREEEGGKEKEDKPTQAELLLRYASEAELFHTPAGDAYATIPAGDHRETHPVKHKAFRRWLLRQFYEENGKPPGTQALQEALGVLEAKADYAGPEREVFVRVAGYGGAIYIDLANEAWEAAEITASGWRIISEPPVRFRRPKGMKPLPRPQDRGADAGELGEFINVSGPQQLTLILAWAVAALRDRGPYPVLVLRGEQGSAKSTTARLLRDLVDPVVAPARSLPASERDLAISAQNQRVGVFDNVSRLPDWLSDALSRLATGGGLSTRELYSDDEEVLFDATRPVILNGITDVATRPDLLDRTVIVEMSSIPDEERRKEADIMAAFEKKRPALLGALFNAASRALATVDDVALSGYPRMADFAAWATAAEAGLGLEEGAFMAAYSANRAAATETALEADPVAEAVFSLMADREEYSATATELWEALGEQVSEEVRKSKTWPGAPNALTGRLRRLAPELREVGIEFSEGSRHGPAKNKTLTKNEAEKDRPNRPNRPAEEDSSEEWEVERDDGGDDDRRGDDKTVPLYKDRPAAEGRHVGEGDGGDDGDDDFSHRSRRRF